MFHWPMGSQLVSGQFDNQRERQRLPLWQYWSMSDHHTRLIEAVDASQSEMIDFTRELVAIPSENPPGNEYARCAGVIAEKLKEIGLEPRVVEVPAPKPGQRPGYCVTACHGEGEPALHFHGHY